MRISDWSSDVCSSDLGVHADAEAHAQNPLFARRERRQNARHRFLEVRLHRGIDRDHGILVLDEIAEVAILLVADRRFQARSEEHTSELQSLMRISYAVFCLKKKNKNHTQQESQLYT